MDKNLENLIFEDCQKSCIDITFFSIMKNQTILITGGTGFVGKWVIEMISYINKKSDYNIKLILMARDIEKFKTEVPHLHEKKFISYIEKNTRDISDLPNETDYIIHAAGSPDKRDHISDPIKTIDNSYLGTKALYESAVHLKKLKKIIVLSSHQIYGDNDSGELIKEDYKGVIKRNLIYSQSKVLTELLSKVFIKNNNLPIIIMRPFAFLGPYQSLEKPWAINNFIRDVILGSSVRILGNPTIKRSYLYGSDMAYWILKTLIAGKTNDVYNLGSSQPITLFDLAKLIIKISKKNDTEIINKSSIDDFLKNDTIVPDVSKIKKIIGLEEKHTIEQSVYRTILWNEI